MPFNSNATIIVISVQRFWIFLFGKLLEQVHQVLERVKLVLFCRYDHAVDDRAALRPTRRVRKQPIPMWSPE